MKIRYNKVFKSAVIVLIVCALIFGSMVAYFAVSKMQYENLIADMKSIEATVIDMKGDDAPQITVSYDVNGVTYQRELKADSAISFLECNGGDCSVGDKGAVFYDPENPFVIAVPRSDHAGYFSVIIGAIGLALVLCVLICLVVFRRKFLVTLEDCETNAMTAEEQTRSEETTENS